MQVCKCQARHGVCKGVCVEGVRHIGIVTLHAVHTVKHTTNQEAVSIVTSPKACAKSAHWLEISGMEVGEQDYFLVETLRVQSGVK